MFVFYILHFFCLVPFYDDEISNNLDEGRRRQNKGADFTFDNQRHYDGKFFLCLSVCLSVFSSLSFFFLLGSDPI
jgi:hypothetical protein